MVWQNSLSRMRRAGSQSSGGKKTKPLPKPIKGRGPRLPTTTSCRYDRSSASARRNGRGRGVVFMTEDEEEERLMVVGAEEREEQLDAVDSRGVADEKDEYVVDRRRDTWSTVPKVADT